MILGLALALSFTLLLVAYRVHVSATRQMLRRRARILRLQSDKEQWLRQISSGITRLGDRAIDASHAIDRLTDALNGVLGSIKHKP